MICLQLGRVVQGKNWGKQALKGLSAYCKGYTHGDAGLTNDSKPVRVQQPPNRPPAHSKVLLLDGMDISPAPLGGKPHFRSVVGSEPRMRRCCLLQQLVLIWLLPYSQIKVTNSYSCQCKLPALARAWETQGAELQL